MAIVSHLFSRTLAEVEGSPLPCRTGCTDKLEEARALGGCWSLKSRQELGASGRYAPHHKQKLLSGERTCDVLVASDGLLMLLHRQSSQAS